MTARLPTEALAINRAVKVADNLRIAVLDPSGLYPKVQKYLQKKTEDISLFRDQGNLDKFLACLSPGPIHIVVLIGLGTPLSNGMGLGMPHEHLNPVELTYLNLSGQRLMVARLVNF